MNSCPNCKGILRGVDTLGIFAFERRSLRVIWLLFVCFLVLLWSVLVVILVRESARTAAVIVYYILSCVLVYKLYKRKLSKVVYECQSCKSRYIGPDLTEFDYKTWSKNKYKNVYRDKGSR